MGNTWGDKLGGGASYADKGAGRSVSPNEMPKYSAVMYSSWQRGMVAFLSPENTPENAGRDVVDTSIERDDSLIRPPGIAIVEDVSPRLLRWVFQQSGLDYSTELVAIDAPYMGRKSVGSFSFVNAGIAAPGIHGWNAVNVLGTLIFSDGSSVTYARETNAVVVIDISASIIARTFANAFGRTFAGAYTDPIDGLQSLGLAWNGTSGLYNDWAGAGSGVELLIANTMQADRIVALRPIGFDALGILCRSSIWIGYPTGQADRPADPRIRQVGLGCVAETAVAVTPDGIAFLSDDGVVIFSLNDMSHISEAINVQLLPIDYTQLEKYILIYDSKENELKLQTPDCTWVYEFARPEISQPARWTKRSFALEQLVMFTDQSGGLYWGEVTSIWAAESRTWAEMIVTQSDANQNLYVSNGSVLGRLDPTEEEYLGVAMTPSWETRNTPVPTEDGPSITEQVTTMGFELQYSCTSVCEITIDTPDENGDFTNSFVQELVSTVGKRRRATIWNTTTGQGVKCRIRITAGRPNIYSLKQIVMDSGPQIGSAA